MRADPKDCVINPIRSDSVSSTSTSGKAVRYSGSNGAPILAVIRANVSQCASRYSIAAIVSRAIRPRA
jgi:hypothetical protein